MKYWTNQELAFISIQLIDDSMLMVLYSFIDKKSWEYLCIQRMEIK